MQITLFTYLLTLQYCAGDSHLRCRVVNRPYDIFGTWFSDQHLISGDLHWLAHLVSTSVLWLNKANQEIDSEHVPIMNQLYKFYNKKATLIRGIMVANCPWMDDEDVAMTNDESEPSTSNNVLREEDVKRVGNPLSHPKLAQPGPSSPIADNSSDIDMPHCQPSNDGSRAIRYSDEFRKEFDDSSADDRLEDDDEDGDDSQMCNLNPLPMNFSRSQIDNIKRFCSYKNQYSR